MARLGISGPRGRKAARALLFLAALGCAGRGEGPGDARLGPEGFSSPVLSDDQLARVGALPPGSEEWRRIFSVFVAGRPDDPLFGDYRLEGRRILFAPRYPPRPGVSYTARFQPLRISDPGGSGPRYAIEWTFEVAAPPPGPRARVLRVAPTRDVLPENQLKFYVYFSAPMARGEAYSRVRLRSDGKDVEHPFLELGEELWDHSGTRLTLLFDPGRIKRELLPREEAGPSLEAGKSYVLEIDGGWQDAEGKPLESGFRKAFRAVGPDERQPDPARWTLAPPRAGTRDPLVALFDEPLDHAMLGRVLEVVDPSGAVLEGRIDIDAEETRWRFHPAKVWAAGRHGLRVDTLIEDLAGNSIAKPFEVDVFRRIERQVVSKFVTLPFEPR